MATRLDFIANVKAVDIKKTAATVMQMNADNYTEENRKQMNKGRRKEGSKIMDAPGQPYRSISYARDKARMNPDAGFYNPDLRLTGSFQNLMYMNVKGEDIIMDSADSKTGALVKKYGGSIFGIMPTSDFAERFLLPDFQAEITRQTGLTY